MNMFEIYMSGVVVAFVITLIRLYLDTDSHTNPNAYLLSVILISLLSWLVPIVGIINYTLNKKDKTIFK